MCMVNIHKPLNDHIKFHVEISGQKVTDVLGEADRMNIRYRGSLISQRDADLPYHKLSYFDVHTFSLSFK